MKIKTINDVIGALVSYVYRQLSFKFREYMRVSSSIVRKNKIYTKVLDILNKSY